MKFGDNVPTFTIGEKRDTGIEDGPGPGTYEPDRELTKTRAPNTIIPPVRNDSSSPQRGTENVGPGTYEEKGFGSGKKSFTFGRKLEEVIR